MEAKKVRRQLLTNVDICTWTASCEQTGEIVECCDLATLMQAVSKALVRNPLGQWRLAMTSPWA